MSAAPQQAEQLRRPLSASESDLEPSQLADGEIGLDDPAGEPRLALLLQLDEIFVEQLIDELAPGLVVT